MTVDPDGFFKTITAPHLIPTIPLPPPSPLPVSPLTIPLIDISERGVNAATEIFSGNFLGFLQESNLLPAVGIRWKNFPEFLENGDYEIFRTSRRFRCRIWAYNERFFLRNTRMDSKFSARSIISLSVKFLRK